MVISSLKTLENFFGYLAWYFQIFNWGKIFMITANVRASLRMSILATFEIWAVHCIYLPWQSEDMVCVLCPMSLVYRT